MQENNKFKKFLINVGLFFVKGFTVGKWEVHFKWKI